MSKDKSPEKRAREGLLKMATERGGEHQMSENRKSRSERIHAIIYGESTSGPLKKMCRQGITSEDIEAAYEAGMLRKDDLKEGHYYAGTCRNASIALWRGDRFSYMRSKFGSRFSEDIFHPEDDNGFDLFIPLFEDTPDENEIIRE